jgi:hypothetical protein
MKRSSFTFSPDYARASLVETANGQQAILGTFLLAITIATTLFGAIWYA